MRPFLFLFPFLVHIIKASIGSLYWTLMPLLAAYYLFYCVLFLPVAFLFEEFFIITQARQVGRHWTRLSVLVNVYGCAPTFHVLIPHYNHTVQGVFCSPDFIYSPPPAATLFPFCSTWWLARCCGEKIQEPYYISPSTSKGIYLPRENYYQTKQKKKLLVYKEIVDIPFSWNGG